MDSTYGHLIIDGNQCLWVKGYKAVDANGVPSNKRIDGVAMPMYDVDGIWVGDEVVSSQEASVSSIATSVWVYLGIGDNAVVKCEVGYAWHVHDAGCGRLYTVF